VFTSIENSKKINIQNLLTILSDIPVTGYIDIAGYRLIPV